MFPAPTQPPACSTLDDPFVISAMLPWTFIWNEYSHHGIRWSICARQICYRNHLLGSVFGAF